ncbi:MAG: DNA polymerase III subunit beta [Patescibacteria group bacterium]|nr:DNA polymerase III subunit beta [Patescibacteria group bacterium]
MILKIIDSKNTLPVLNNFLIDVQSDKIIITTTNLEHTLRIVITDNISIGATGKTTVPAKLLAQYIALLSDTDVSFELSEHTLKIKAGRDKTEIMCIDPEEFPALPDMDVQTQARTVSHLLAEGFDRTSFACSNDIARATLTGTSLIIEQSTAFVAATDSYRLAEKQFQLEQTSGQDIKCIIPKKAADELISILSFDQQPVEIEAKTNQITFQIGASMTFATRLIEGNFPAYKQILPQSFNTTANVSKSELLTAIKKTALFSEELKKSIELTIQENMVSLNSVQSQVGHSEQAIDAITDGRENTTNINSQYMLDVLGKIKSDEIMIGINEPHLPVGVQGKDDQGFQYIIMPLKK